MKRDVNWLTSRVEKIPEAGCWIWKGATFKRHGHAKFGNNGKHYFAHRLAWELYRGSIPIGLFVLHRCDVPCCVNPEHLFIGSQSDNAKDMFRKGRSNLYRLRDPHTGRFV